MNRVLPLVALLTACSGGDDTTPTDGTTPPLELQGATYQLNVAGLTVPGADDGLADLLRLFFTRTVLIGLDDASDTGFTMRMGFSEVGSSPMVQDPCSKTIELAGVSLSGLDFDFGPETTVFYGDTLSYTLADLAIAGTFSEDGEAITGVTLGAGFDLRDAEALGFGTATGLCDTLGTLGVPCGACADTEAYCVSLQAEGIGASKVDVVVEAIDNIDPVACPTTTP